jgi:hypothetical protein
MMLLTTTFFVTSCSKDGSNGVDGTNGTNGKTALTKTTKEPAGANCTYGGTKFETGIDANNNGTLESNEVTTTQTKYVCDGAGAIYSSWIDVNITDTLKRLDEETNFYFKQLLPATAITADIVNKGTVLLYYKSKNGVISNIVNGYAVVDVDSSGQTNFSFSPGFLFKEKYLSFLVSSWIGYKDYINNNGSALRYVLIPGDSQARISSNLKKMPYGEMAKLYNITD